MASVDSPSKSPSDMLLIQHGSQGLSIRHGPPNCATLKVLADGTARVRCVDVSDDGRRLAYADAASVVRVLELPSCNTLLEAESPSPSITFIKISPRGSILATYSPYSTSGSGGSPENLCIWDVNAKQLQVKMAQKKGSNWQPYWVKSEEFAARHINTELLFFSENNFTKSISKFNVHKVNGFSLSTSKAATPKHYVAIFTTGAKGQPCFVRIYEYPNLSGNPIAQKSFYKADNVDFKWDPAGTSLLLYTTTDVDKTGKSYYGESNLHFINVRGETFVLTRDKDGPIHAVEWVPCVSPKPRSPRFCVIYGFVPSKAALFNSKGEKVFEFGEPAMRNTICFNPFGNLVALAGFGNLRGDVTIWDMKQKKLIVQIKCTETTNIEWSPDGMHFFTATTAPRLRIGNGFKLWKYNGKLLHQEMYDSNTEMWKLNWQPPENPQSDYPEPQISDTELKTNMKNLPAQTKPAQKYVPPALRNSATGTANQAKPQQAKAKKNREREQLDETATKIKHLKTKLNQIEKLKQQQQEGIELRKEQLDKLAKEPSILEELAKLEIS